MDSPRLERDPTISRQFASRRSSSPPPRGAPNSAENHRGARSPDAELQDGPNRRQRWSPPHRRSPRRSTSPKQCRTRSPESLSPGSSPGSAGRYHGRHRSPAPHWGAPSDRNSDRRTIYVGCLPYHATADDVANFFEQYGEVANVKLIYHHETQEFRGFGFVSFTSQYAAEDASKDANGQELLGNRIKCNIAKYNKAQPRAQGRDERRDPHEPMEGPPSPYYGGTQSVGYRSRHSGQFSPSEWRRESPPQRGSPYSGPTHTWNRQQPSPKRRRRMSSDYEDGGRHNGDSTGQEQLQKELATANSELKAALAEKAQMQREQSQLKQQLDELTVQANAKLSDQRSKIKLAKTRSAHRGKHMMALVDAAQHFQTCQAKLSQAEKEMEKAKVLLAEAFQAANSYVAAERNEDGPDERHKAEPDEKKSVHPTETVTDVSEPAVAQLGNSGIVLKPFKISLDPK